MNVLIIGDDIDSLIIAYPEAGLEGALYKKV